MKEVFMLMQKLMQMFLLFFSGMGFSTLLVETKTVLYDWKQNPFKHRRAFQQTDFVEVSNDRTSKY